MLSKASTDLPSLSSLRFLATLVIVHQPRALHHQREYAKRRNSPRRWRSDNFNFTVLALLVASAHRGENESNDQRDEEEGRIMHLHAGKNAIHRGGAGATGDQLREHTRCCFK